ncbi:hypothetical protein [Pyxidicoccus xibeiensis]|uniref:hypothetical protein n=1 Tax=Pyxidicoccus xibeiensis TaxID=2906759 RepID=UPI0020A75A95|nr:hypothetical protein [Pyxidicoccus xibeiensis]MCP3144433.1 hypothetical protein [Pyxidicoccus xibeiensis]
MRVLDVTSFLPLSGTTVTLDAHSAAGDVLGDQLTRLTDGVSIVIQNATRQVGDGIVTVTGTASLLQMADLPVTVTAEAGPEGPVVTARFTLIAGTPGPNAWRFSNSFPSLPPLHAGVSLTKPAPGVAQAPAPHLLDSLALSDAAFVLTTAAQGRDPVTGAPLRAGFNFVSHCKPSGVLGLLGTVISGGGTQVLYGPILVPKPGEVTLPPPATPSIKFPWQLAQLVPGIHLSADLGVDASLGEALRFHDVGLRIYCPVTQAWADANHRYPQRCAAAAKLEVPSAGLSLDLTAAGLGSLTSLMLFGQFDGVRFGKLEQLLDLAGGGDLAAQLPDDVQQGLGALSALSLEAVTVGLGQGLRVQSVGLTIGMSELETKVLPGLELQRLFASFSIVQPFGPQRNLAVTLGGGAQLFDVPFEATLDLPEVAATARLTQGATLPLARLTEHLGLPGVPDLKVDSLQVGMSKAGDFSIAAAMAQTPSWSLDLGPVPLTVSDVRLTAGRAAGGTSTGSFSGAIALGDDLRLDCAWQTPGDFVVRAELPDVRLMELVGKLANQDVSLPGDFDLELTDGSVLIQHAGSNLVFRYATTMEHVGTLAFEARRVSNKWGFAAGIDLSALRLSALPGLGGLKPFEDLFRMDQLMVVVSSFEDPGFQLPSLAAFNSPILRTGNLKLPSQAGGVIAGLNAYARWTIDTSSREQELLRKLLGLDPSLGITLQVGKQPTKDSRLYVSYDTRIQGHPFRCMVGGQMKDGQVGLFLTGALETRIQGRTVLFDVTTLFVANGAFLSGSMVGSVEFAGLTLSNVALVVGVSWEALPSLGIAATLAVDRFNSSLAIFFDSTDPTRSMLAGSLSDLSLRDVVDTLAGKVLPSEVDAVLPQVELVGTQDFTVGAELATALDNLQVAEVSAAFAAQGITLPAAVSQVLLVASRPGKQWFITDMARMVHYSLEKVSGGIRVRLSPQFYFAPNNTAIGALRFEQGMFLNAGLKVLGLEAMAKVLVKPTQGIVVDGRMDRIVIGNEKLFCLESTDGKGGPRISAATFNQPEVADAAMKGPHFLIDASMTLLGMTRSAYVSVGSKGFAFDISGILTPGSTYSLRGQFKGLTQLSAGGSLHIGIGTVDLGPLGKVHVDTGVQGQLDAGVDGSKLWAKFRGEFGFLGRQWKLQEVDLDVKTASLPELPKQVLSLVERELRDLSKDAKQWIRLVYGGAIQGVTDVAGVLKTSFGLAIAETAALMHAAGYAADAVSRGLKSAYGATDDQVAKVLKLAGYAASDVGNALKSVYGVTADQAAKMLRGAGYTVNDVGNALKSVYGATADEAAKLLKEAGFAASAVGSALKAAYGATSQTVGAALKAAGYGVNEVSKALKDAYKLGPDALKKAMKGIGYSSSQIKSAFKSLGGAFEDFGKELGDKLDPTKW